MASLTPWPTTGRASRQLSFFTTDDAVSCAPGTITPSPASSPSVASSRRPTRSLRPGMPSQRAGDGDLSGAELAQLLRDLGRARREGHVA